MDFEELVNRISPKLKAIAKRLNGRFAFFDEDDLCQEALLNLWQKHINGELLDKTDSYIVQGSLFFLKNYIRLICKQIDLKSSGLNMELEDKTLEEVIFASDPKMQYGFMMVDLLVEDILDILSEREREVFLLSLEDLTTREMGERLGVSHAMVIKIEKRIRRKCQGFRKEIL